jgi:urea carboxylase
MWSALTRPSAWERVQRKTRTWTAKKCLPLPCKRGACAIHPGYGFLSENVAFARACEEAGVTFIGPDPEQIEQFGLKHVARSLAERAGVPLLPGTGLINDVDEALRAAEEIGYPVMLKSTAGGGGIGMRVCADADQLASAFEAVAPSGAGQLRRRRRVP